MQTVKVFGVQDRRSTAQAKLPWVVRYAIDGRHRSKSFRTRIDAERYRGSLLQAVQAGRVVGWAITVRGDSTTILTLESAER